MIEFISYEEFPEDPYIKEMVYLQIEPQSRIAYVRKPMKNGGMFWSPISCAVMKNGAKKYFDSIELDSNFLKKDILAFLEARSWDVNVRTTCKAAVHSDYQTNHIVPMPAPHQSIVSQMSFLDDCPF